MRKMQILMNMPIYSDLSILNVIKTVMYEFWYAYLKPKYNENAKVCYTDADGVIVHLEAEHIYKDIA